MRLLNIHSYELRVFPHPAQRPPYVITSHRWVEPEITFQQFLLRDSNPSIRRPKGCAKIESFCQFVQQWHADLEWIWIDTCCINKDSSNELSEAINSMFRWYSEAVACIAYLHDVRGHDRGGPGLSISTIPESYLADFQASVWFKRGWTLQELVAPKLVIFLNQDWQIFGHKSTASSSLHNMPTMGPRLDEWIAPITGIPEDVLRNPSECASLDMQKKLKWMQGRATTRPEDSVYCLLGICGVCMALIYGEGEEGAMDRLEEEVEKKLARARKKAKVHSLPVTEIRHRPSKAVKISGPVPGGVSVGNKRKRSASTPSVAPRPSSVDPIALVRSTSQPEAAKDRKLTHPLVFTRADCPAEDMSGRDRGQDSAQHSQQSSKSSPSRTLDSPTGFPTSGYDDLHERPMNLLRMVPFSGCPSSTQTSETGADQAEPYPLSLTAGERTAKHRTAEEDRPP